MERTKIKAIIICAGVLLVLSYFIFLKPEVADAMITLVEAFIGFLGGALGATATVLARAI